MYSILFKNKENLKEREYSFFKDLNLSSIIEEICKGYKEVDLRPFFYTMLSDEETIKYRLDVFKDLKQDSLRYKIASFANRLQHVLMELDKIASIEKPNYAVKADFLNLLHMYLSITEELRISLRKENFSSEGVLLLQKELEEQVQQTFFITLKSDLEKLDEMMRNVDFNLLLNEGFIYVTKPYFEENGFSEEINNLLSPLISNDEEIEVSSSSKSLTSVIKKSMLHIVSNIYPEEFKFLNSFYERYLDFVPENLKNFPKEFFFYTAYLSFMEKIKTMGLPFCIPEISTKDKEFEVMDSYDIALAKSFLYTDRIMILNDFYLKGKERILIISGPNQGGKTTFARMFGQLCYLASLGVPVPGTKAKVFVPDQIFTHFEVEESVIKATGKLNEELLRLKEIMDLATSNSLVILNEVFSSTSIADGLVLGKKFLDQIQKLDALCVFVTFLDELSKYKDSVVSMISTVIPKTPEVRTLKIIRQEADGLAYAEAIAKKYSLDYESIQRRIQHEG